MGICAPDGRLERNRRDGACDGKGVRGLHLYNLERRTTLHDRERNRWNSSRVKRQVRTLYIYDGLKLDLQRYGGQIRNISGRSASTAPTGTEGLVMREFETARERS